MGCEPDYLHRRDQATSFLVHAASLAASPPLHQLTYCPAVSHIMYGRTLQQVASAFQGVINSALVILGAGKMSQARVIDLRKRGSQYVSHFVC